MLYVLDCHELQIRIYKEHHDHSFVGHLGVAKTFNLVRREYY
jgi:hypothetical protein